jgi:RNA polymerase sigma-70 factor (ECF subfamily)
VQPLPDADRADRRISAFRDACATEAAFRAWYELALPQVYGYVQGRAAGDRDLAEEITQQAFEAALRARDAYDGRADPAVWICSIARNALVDHYRRERRERLRHLSLVVREIHLDGDARSWTTLEDRDELLVALRELTADQRLALVTHYVDHLPVRDVAALLHRSETSVESLLARGRERLRGLLGAAR